MITTTRGEGQTRNDELLLKGVVAEARNLGHLSLKGAQYTYIPACNLFGLDIAEPSQAHSCRSLFYVMALLGTLQQANNTGLCLVKGARRTIRVAPGGGSAGGLAVALRVGGEALGHDLAERGRLAALLLADLTDGLGVRPAETAVSESKRPS